MENFIRKTPKDILRGEEVNNFIIIDWKDIANKIDLVTPFYKKLNLFEYVGSYSLDTLNDIILDKDFIKTDVVKIQIVNFNDLLKNDLSRKKLFMDLLLNFVLYSTDVSFQIYVSD